MKSDHMQNRPRHPIRVVARRTGLRPDVLRVWERRYGVVEPTRSEGGQRLYSDADIERLSLLQRASAAGRAIGQIATLPTAELVTLVAEDEAGPPGAGPVGRDDATAEHLEAAWLAASAFAPARLEAALRHAFYSLGGRRLIEGVLGPLLERLGEAWEAGRLTPAHEHAASAVVRRLLDVMGAELQPPDGAPVIVIATPAGELHEFGALLAATTAAAAGWRIIYLGCDLPAKDIARAALETGARIVGLSLVHVRQVTKVAHEIAVVTQELDGRAKVVLGGRATRRLGSSLPKGTGEIVSDLPAFRQLLARHA
jgi:DNA-binding transcriptional MerR regulator/methylmalonyl-CoA mutase cobalamin-binding subunit